MSPIISKLTQSDSFDNAMIICRKFVNRQSTPVRSPHHKDTLVEALAFRKFSDCKGQSDGSHVSKMQMISREELGGTKDSWSA